MKNIKLYSIVLCLFLPLFIQAQETSSSFFVDGICGMCEDRIEEAANNFKGVLSSDWDVDERLLVVTYQEGDLKVDRLQKYIASIGHDTEKYTAPQDAYDNLHGCCKYRSEEVVNAHTPASPTVSIFVNGACAMCRDRIENAVLQLEGVKTASWDMTSRMLTVETSPDFPEEQLHWAVTAIGHDTREWLASEEAYSNLHECCAYRELAPPVPAEDPEVIPLFEDLSIQERPVSGTISEQVSKRVQEPLIGVNVFWEDTKAGTVTDENGFFEMPRNTENHLLVVSYIGYEPDTIDMTDQYAFELIMSEALTLETVEVTYRKKSSSISFTDPIKALEIDSKELLKAACCNLSESFETNPSVDVSFTDAVTGTRQIQMLGLAGPYVQITQELLPGARGLSAIQGMSYIPGPWIQSIQLIKGPGSVVNGFESMAGQINVELKKPDDAEKLYVNLYANEGGRLEGNITTAFQLNEKVSTGILVHGNLNRVANDRNEDGFLDNALGDEFILVNRWKFQGNNGWVGQAGVKATFFDRASGQVSDNYQTQIDPDNPRWTAIQNTDRVEAWAKTGRIFPDNPLVSIGIQASAVMHRQTSRFGNNNDFRSRYISDQNSAFFNFIYQRISQDTKHELKLGASFQYDNIEEGFFSEEFVFGFDEYIPGAYAEYAYTPTEDFSAVLGVRGDHHNLYGAFFTPRLHIRYAFAEESVLRASAGKGWRRPAIYMEQIGAFASNREFIIQNAPFFNPGAGFDTPYGLNPEVSWNFGLNFTQGIRIGLRELLLSADAYHTMFTSQVVADYDQSPQTLVFYNLDGRSYSNSLQFQADYEILEGWDIRLAYRFNDVQTEFQDAGLREKPFVARHRSFVNTSYETVGGWAFDFTLNRIGSKRIADTFQNPEEFQLEERSPDFFLANAQISKSWNKVFDIYLGAENLFNFRQESPILDYQNPDSEFFDASLVWGPIFGRMIYTGIRWTIE